MSGEAASIDAFDAQDPMLLKVLAKGLASAPVAGYGVELTDYKAFDPGVQGLRVLWVDPVVTYLRIGHRDDLAAIGGIGEDLLVAGHTRIEDHFPTVLATSAKTEPSQDGAVLEGKQRRYSTLGGKHDVVRATSKRALRTLLRGLCFTGQGYSAV